MKRLITFILASVICAMSINAQQKIKVGIIGLDTSHSPAFIKMLNSENPEADFAGFQVVAAYPYGSKAIPSSLERIPKYTEEAKASGVKITTSIDELLKMVDCVMLETNDGNMHLEQAEKVLKSGKTLFIDKPIGATLPQAIAIFSLGKKYNAPLFSSSALRFVSQNQDLRNGKLGAVIGADTYSPCVDEPSHADIFWYGIHGVETLFTVMGKGCVSVSATTTEGGEVAVGLWQDERIGTFRGIRKGQHAFGGTAICEKKVHPIGGYDGYQRLLKAVLQFFKTKEVPVSPEETLEIFTFMETANESKRQGGKPIMMQDVYKKAEIEAKKLLK